MTQGFRVDQLGRQTCFPQAWRRLFARRTGVEEKIASSKHESIFLMYLHLRGGLSGDVLWTVRCPSLEFRGHPRRRRKFERCRYLGGIYSHSTHSGSFFEQSSRLPQLLHCAKRKTALSLCVLPRPRPPETSARRVTRTIPDV